jgi:hypothetical protein
VDNIFTKEDRLSEKYMFNLSFSLNNSCIYEHMIKTSYDDMLKSGLVSLLNERKYEQLVLLYSYIHDVELMTPLKDAWSQYIYDKGMYFINAL